MNVHFFSAPCQILQAPAYMAARPKGWIPREGGGKAQSFKASQLHSPLSNLMVRADGERNRFHGHGGKADRDCQEFCVFSLAHHILL